MAIKNYGFYFDEENIGEQYYRFTDETKKHIVAVLKGDALVYVPYFKFVIKFLLFNKYNCLSVSECRQVILRYAVLFCYVAFKEQLGDIPQFDDLIADIKITGEHSLFQSVKGTNNPLVKIFNNQKYKGEFRQEDIIKDKKTAKKIHNILVNDYDYFTQTTDVTRFSDNRTAFDLMICDVAFNGADLFDEFEIEFEDIDKYIPYFKNGQKVNFFVLGFVLHNIIDGNLSHKNIIQLETRTYYRIANIGNTSDKLSPSYIAFLFSDEENGFYKIDYSIIKEELRFKYNDEQYSLSNKGIEKITNF